MAEERETILVLDCDPAFCAGASFGLPLEIGLLGSLPCSSKDCVDSAVDPVSRAFDASPPSSCSKGDPFSIDPNGGFPSSGAVPSETVATDFGSDRSIVAVLSSAVESGLSCLVAEGIQFFVSDFS